MEESVPQEIDRNLIIINLVEGQPVLYNKKDENYKDNVKKDKAWTKIAKMYKSITKEYESGKSQT